MTAQLELFGGASVIAPASAIATVLGSAAAAVDAMRDATISRVMPGMILRALLDERHSISPEVRRTARLNTGDA